MTIGIDARFVGPQGTGLGKYTEKLVENLAKIDSKNNYVIFLSPEGARETFGWGNAKNFRIVTVDIPWYSIAEQRKLPNVFKQENLDLLHVPHFNVPIFYRGKFVVTIHDLIHHSFSETSATTRNPIIFNLKRIAYKKVISHAVKKSRKVIVPSNFVKDQVANHFKISLLKVVVTYEAAEEEYSNYPLPATNYKLLEKFSIRKPFLIYVGNAYPHKNLDRLLDAFQILVRQHSRSGHKPASSEHSFASFNHSRSGQKAIPSKHSGSEKMLNLVIVCARDVFAKRLEERIDSLNLLSRVTLTGYIEANELSEIFKSAEAYVFPSLSEGFGIPGLNAMASGLPVVCSDSPTLREIYGKAAMYFDPTSPEDIAKKIREVLSDSKKKASLIKLGSQQVKKYSWHKMAQETLKVYLSV